MLHHLPRDRVQFYLVYIAQIWIFSHQATVALAHLGERQTEAICHGSKLRFHSNDIWRCKLQQACINCIDPTILMNCRLCSIHRSDKSFFFWLFDVCVVWVGLEKRTRLVEKYILRRRKDWLFGYEWLKVSNLSS